MFIQPEALAALQRHLLDTNFSEFCSPHGTISSHGGRLSLALVAEIMYHPSLLDVANQGRYIFIDAGSGIGQAVAFAGLVDVGSPIFTIGVEVN